MHLSIRHLPLFSVCLGVLLTVALPGYGWRPSLYPENWTPPETASFSTDKLIQDFSYAGYRRGEEPLPSVEGPFFNAAIFYGADPTGSSDSTASIQAAIDAASAAGGGVVYLPAGTYLVEPSGNNNFALRIQNSNVVLRGAGVGETFILNTSYQMRLKSVIRIAAPSTSFGPGVNITSELDSPTRKIPVSDASDFEVGDHVRLQWQFTQDWIDEHNQGNWWSSSSRPANATYMREVMAVNTDEGWIEVDVPIRYTMRPRDNAQVRRISGQLSGVGLEDFSIGNIQHPGNGWGERDYTDSTKAAYDTHYSWLILMLDTYDSWINRVESYQAPANTSTCHLLSNGILLQRVFRITLADIAMRRSQYGGGGGNGYMFRILSGNEVLVRDTIADFSRHGFVVSHAGSSGNVFLRCEDRETRRSTGSSGSYQTNGSGSDHHMHFSHSNLFDSCHAHNSFWTAHHRGTSGTVPHGLTAAHVVYWNMSGSGTRYTNIVRSEQARYGYVIGTSGSQSGATNPTGGNTAPADHLEGIGIGDNMEPQSLYLDQLARRSQGVLIFLEDQATTHPTVAHPLGAEVYSYGSGPISYKWSQISGPVTALEDPTSLNTNVALEREGLYVFRLTVEDGGQSAHAEVSISVLATEPRASSDAIVGRRQDNAPALGYYPGHGSDTIGAGGSDANLSRVDQNIVLSYELPTLPAATLLEGATLRFEITAYRNHSGADPGLDVYLLETTDPSDSGTAFFFHGQNDPNPQAFRIGGTNLSGPQGEEVNYPSGTHVQTYAFEGAALAWLQEIYGDDRNPSQEEVFIRFNLDNLVSGGGNGDLEGSTLDRYRIDVSPEGSGLNFHVRSDPERTNFDDWTLDFHLGNQRDFGDDPDGDGIPNAVEAWFGTHPGEPTVGISKVETDGLATTFSHPMNPDMPVDLSGFYEWSPDLVEWYSSGDGPEGAGVVTFVAETEDDTTTVTAQASEEMPRIFLRIVVTRE